MYKASIIMTAYKRGHLIGATLKSIRDNNPQDDYEIIVVEDGKPTLQTVQACVEWNATYLNRIYRPDVGFSNPCVPNNIGIRMAKGQAIIIQNAENKHMTKNSINLMIEPILNNSKISTFASVMALNPDGSENIWYCHPKHNRRPLFFCQAVDRKLVVDMGGFDEDFKDYGYEDDDFARRLSRQCVKFVYLDSVLIHHQWHETLPSNHEGMQRSKALFEKKKFENVIRNQGREWGKLE